MSDGDLVNDLNEAVDFEMIAIALQSSTTSPSQLITTTSTSSQPFLPVSLEWFGWRGDLVPPSSRLFAMLTRESKLVEKAALADCIFAGYILEIC